VGKSTTALEVLSENRFDLVCLDIDMPEMSGVELCSKLRALPLHENTPVIFITTLKEFERGVHSGLSQGSDLIAKPFLYSELGVKALTFIIRGQLQPKG
jgi:DNA-binding response OmpR family regulator